MAFWCIRSAINGNMRIAIRLRETFSLSRRPYLPLCAVDELKCRTSAVSNRLKIDFIMLRLRLNPESSGRAHLTEEFLRTRSYSTALKVTAPPPDPYLADLSQVAWKWVA